MSTHTRRTSCLALVAGLITIAAHQPHLKAETPCGNELTALPGVTNSGFGLSVATDGDFFVVGAPFSAQSTGAAFLYQKTEDGEWDPNPVNLAMLVPFGPAPNDMFGRAVAISGDTILVGAPGRQVGASLARGEVYEFVYNSISNSWSFAGTLTSPVLPEAEARFGRTIAYDGQHAIIGAPVLDMSNGAAYIFRRDGDGWSDVTAISPPIPDDFINFGEAVDIQQGLAVIGAPEVGGNIGAAYIYRLVANEWVLEASLPPQAGFFFGRAVATNGFTVFVGAPVAGPESGQVYAYQLVNDAWVIIDEHQNPDSSRPGFGAGIASNGGTTAIGAVGLSTKGAVYILQQTGDCDFKMQTFELEWTLDKTPILPCAKRDTNANQYGLALAVGRPQSPDDPKDPAFADLIIGAPGAMMGMVFTSLVVDNGEDCNGSGLPDCIDIITGFSADCNGDMIPDECQDDVVFNIFGYDMDSAMKSPTTGGAVVRLLGENFPNGMQGMTIWMEVAGGLHLVDTDTIEAFDCDILEFATPAIPPPCDCGEVSFYDTDIIFQDRSGHTMRLSDAGLSFVYNVTKSIVSPGQSIQLHIDNAIEGTCIVLNPGVYRENPVIGPNAHKVTLTSTNIDAPGMTRIRGGDNFNPIDPTVTVLGSSSDISICGLNIVIGDSGVLVKGDAQVFLFKNRIENNWAKIAGGGVRAESDESGDPTTTIEECMISLNTAYSDSPGGGVAILAGNATIINTRILSNETVGGHGGAIFVDNADVKIYTNEMILNVCGGNGGGIAVVGEASADIRDNHIIQNQTKTSGMGGALFVNTGASSINISANELIENFCSGVQMGGANDLGRHQQGGGGIHLAETTIADVRLNRIVDNFSVGSGGGIYCDQPTNVLIENNLIQGNWANHYYGFGGGVYVAAFNLAMITENIIKDNIAIRGGGIATAIKSEAAIHRNVIAFNEALSQTAVSYPTGYDNTTIAIAPGVMVGEPNEFVGPAPMIFDNTYYENFATSPQRQTATIHGIRMGIFEPMWIYNIISSGNLPTPGVNFGMLCDEGPNTGVRMEFNLAETSSDIVSPNCEIIGAPPFMGNMMGDPMFVDPENCDFRVFPNSVARQYTGDIHSPIGAAKPDGLVCFPLGQVHDTGSGAAIKFPPIDDDDDDDEMRPSLQRGSSSCGFLPILPTEVYIDVHHLPRKFTTPSANELDAVTLFVDIKTFFGSMPIGPDGFTLCIPVRAPLKPGQNVTLYRSTSTNGPFMPLGVAGVVDETGESVEFSGLTATGMQIDDSTVLPYIFVGAYIGPDCNGNGIPDDDDPAPCEVTDDPDCVSPDINRDGVVNAQDLGMLLASWGSDDENCDLNNDGVVNAHDLGILLSMWGVMPIDHCRK